MCLPIFFIYSFIYSFIHFPHVYLFSRRKRGGGKKKRTNRKEKLPALLQKGAGRSANGGKHVTELQNA